MAPPFPPASFDAVTSRYLLWTLREPLAALRHWRELLRPGGLLAAVDGAWFADGPPAEDPAVRRAVSHALYYQTIATDFLEGSSDPGTGLLPDTLPQAVANQVTDPAQAAASTTMAR